jgi:hypothetical protein
MIRTNLFNETMPIEAAQLEDQPSPIVRCPFCSDEPFRPFLRGLVQRKPFKVLSWPPFKPQAYCALICWRCKKIVGYE